MYKTLSYFTEVLHREFTAFCSARLQEIGFTQGLMYFVIYIGNHPNCSPGALASTMKYDNGHTARCLDKLVTDGFITRTRNANDRRAYLLCLTEKGENALDEVRNILVEWDKLKFTDVLEEDRAELLRLLEKVEPKLRQHGSDRQF